jgi:rubrerythrin
MLSARAIYQEIRDHDLTYQLFLSIASDGEAQGGWENDRIAALTSEPELAAKIQRHAEDEHKHGRLFQALLRKRALAPAPVPDAVDYTRLLEAQGIGLSHERLRRDEPLSDEEVITYLVHSRVTEQRAAEEVSEQCRIFGDDPELGRAVRMIADDESRHLAYTHEELLRFCDLGHGTLIRDMLRRYAQAEVRTYRDVSLGVMGRMGECLGWSRAKRVVLAFGIHAIYLLERLYGWRRMTTLSMPDQRDAMGQGGPARPRVA